MHIWVDRFGSPFALILNGAFTSAFAFVTWVEKTYIPIITALAITASLAVSVIGVIAGIIKLWEWWEKRQQRRDER